MKKGFVVLESGEIFEGRWRGGRETAGELVFNTGHAGYEEIATDPSYYKQIMVMTAPMQGNYGSRKPDWESSKIQFEGFVCLEMQKSIRDSAWLKLLTEGDTPVIDEIDTRAIVMRVRDRGTPLSAILSAEDEAAAKERAKPLIATLKTLDSDWSYLVSRKTVEFMKGMVATGPRVAVLDFGIKQNILRDILKFTSEVAIFPSRSTAQQIRDWAPQGILLSNGPGDPSSVKIATETIRQLLGWRPVFGICMGHQLLALALGGTTYKMPFGHRGGNHPVKDELLGKIYMTSQNHGYAVKADSLPADARVTHVNLYDKTVEGIESRRLKCFSVQFHPESHPGPREAGQLFQLFKEQLT